MTEHASSEVREFERQSFSIAFETLLEHLSSGRTHGEFCRTYHTPLDPGRFRSWIFLDRKRREAYYVAKAVGAEAVEDELLRISDGITSEGTPSPDTIERAQLQINTRKWLLQVNNRKRYGDTKYVEQTTTQKFDPSSLSTVELEQRLLTALGISPDVD
jgi:hypothetical protein